MTASAWLHRLHDAYAARDRGNAALRRALRCAVVMPGAFALVFKVLDNPGAALFAAFGSFAMLLFVEFSGPASDRLRSQAALVVVSGGLSCLGTLCSRDDVTAVAAMAVVAAAVIFSGVVSAALAAATQSLLLSFILPVAVPAPASAIPSHLLGWGIAGGLSLVAITVLPAPSGDPLRVPVLGAVSALAGALRAEPDDAAARAATEQSLETLTWSFLATPFRPTGLTTATRAGIRLVDELRWLGRIMVAAVDPPAPPIAAAVHGLRRTIAGLLEQVAGVLGDDTAAGREALTQAHATLRTQTRALPDEVASLSTGLTAGSVTALDPAFKLGELAFMAGQVAGNVEVVAAAAARSWPARLIGRQPAGFEGSLASARERAGAHLVLSSATARNALRGGAALGVAILIERLTGVQHAFWVSLGALAILRSNALSTGQTFARALGGTVIGFVIGAAVVALVGTDRTLLWVLLPFAVLIAGTAPAVISFSAGQAAFTLVLFIVFNIIAPAGYRLGIVRLEDVALGGATSLVVGVLFWPRGAGAALGRALADSYAASASYLSASVAWAVSCCAPGMAGAGPRPQARDAAAANRRLDDTFRTYLAERGPKRIGLAGVVTLVEGASTLRLSADAILELWHGEGDPTRSRVAAAAELSRRADVLRRWCDRFGAALHGDGALPEPMPPDVDADARLVAAVADDLAGAGGDADDLAGRRAAVRVLWTGDHLDAARRLSDGLLAPARERARGG